MLNDQRGAVRSVMDMSLFLMLLLSGIFWSASGLWRRYHYINQKKTWASAQSYCRARFTDLATVDSMDDVNMMINTVNDGFRGSVWIGLKRGTQGRWGWSMGSNRTRYSAWYPGQPSGDGHCVSFASSYWYDRPCTVLYQFVCFDESTGYIMINRYKNWTDAQSYCRQFHTDLASVRSLKENNQLGLNNVVGNGPWVWIGLFLDSWQWSDQWSLSFRNWAVGQQFRNFGACVAMSTNDSGKWIQYGCDQQRPFVCYGEDRLIKKQTFRLNLSHDEKYNMNDPSVPTAILNEISEKLKSVGLEGFKNISWRKNEDGEVFHLSKNIVNSTGTCDDDEYTEY